MEKVGNDIIKAEAHTYTHLLWNVRKYIFKTYAGTSTLTSPLTPSQVFLSVAFTKVSLGYVEFPLRSLKPGGKELNELASINKIPNSPSARSFVVLDRWWALADHEGDTEVHIRVIKQVGKAAGDKGHAKFRMTGFEEVFADDTIEAGFMRKDVDSYVSGQGWAVLFATMLLHTLWRGQHFATFLTDNNMLSASETMKQLVYLVIAWSWGCSSAWDCMLSFRLFWTFLITVYHGWFTICLYFGDLDYWTNMAMDAPLATNAYNINWSGCVDTRSAEEYSRYLIFCTFINHSLLTTMICVFIMTVMPIGLKHQCINIAFMSTVNFILIMLADAGNAAPQANLLGALFLLAASIPLCILVQFLNRRNRENWVQSACMLELATENLKLDSYIALKEVEGELLEAQVREEKSQAESEARSLLVSAAAHDLRTPISALTTSCRVLQDSSHSFPDDIQLVLCSMASACKIGLDTVDNMLTASRFLANSVIVPHPSAVDVRELVDNILGLVAEVAVSPQVSIRAEIGDDVPAFVWTDKIWLQRMIMNFLMNSARHTLIGSIEVAMEVRGGNTSAQPLQLYCSVKDTGSGVPPAQEKKIFKTAMDKSYHGSGLGSSIHL